MLEEFLEGLLRGLGEVAAQIVGGIIFGTGWILLRIITLGSYPPAARQAMWTDYKPYSEGFVTFVGFLPWLAAAVYVINRYS